MANLNFGLREEDGKTLGDDSNAHIMSIAPTGAGKGQTSIIPNLLKWPGSCFVIDPKGENAGATVRQRRRLNDAVFVLDPFSIAQVPERASFNPLDFIELGPAGITQADRLADTLIVKEPGGENSHFSNEGRALLKAIILHVRSAPAYEGHRNLGTINQIACAPLALLGDKDKPGQMMDNPAYDGLVSRTALRMRSKGDREGPAVWSTVQANLSQFLDDPRVAESLSRTTPGLDFRNLQTGKVSVFAVLPVQYLETFARWLRLLVGAALDRLLAGMSEQTKPDPPVLFVLDEFAHLGNLEAVKTAYGLARGAGVKVWAILQSLSQLDDIYGQHGRENFIANSGAIEIFNMSDNVGCKYFSEKMGTRDVEMSTVTAADVMQRDRPEGGSHTDTVNFSLDQRPWMRPHEIATLDPQMKIVFRRGKVGAEGQPFSVVRKIWVGEHPQLKGLVG
jgi:type IV secretion system protein VirD4